MAGEAAGDVEQPVAQPLRFAAGEFALEQQPLRPGEQILGDEDELEPGGVRLEGAEGEVAQAGVLAAADPVLDDRVLVRPSRVQSWSEEEQKAWRERAKATGWNRGKSRRPPKPEV